MAEREGWKLCRVCNLEKKYPDKSWHGRICPDCHRADSRQRKRVADGDKRKERANEPSVRVRGNTRVTVHASTNGVAVADDGLEEPTEHEEPTADDSEWSIDDIPPPVTWASAKAAMQAKKAHLEYLQARRELIPVAAVREMLNVLADMIADAFGPDFWTWVERQSNETIEYRTIQNYCTQQESSFVRYTNDWLNTQQGS